MGTPLRLRASPFPKARARASQEKKGLWPRARKSKRPLEAKGFPLPQSQGQSLPRKKKSNGPGQGRANTPLRLRASPFPKARARASQEKKSLMAQGKEEQTPP